MNQDPSRAGRGRALRLVQVGVAIGIFALLLRSGSLQKTLTLRGQVDYVLWIPCVAFLFIMYALGGVGFCLLLKPSSVRSRFQIILSYLYVQALALFTPAQAGEALLPVLLRKQGVASGESAAALLVQRLVGLGLTVTAAAALAPRWVPAGALPILAALAVVGLVVVVLVLRSSRLRTSLPRIGMFLAQVQSTWLQLVRERRVALAAHVATMLVRFATGVAASWVILASFGVRAGFADIAGLAAASTLAALLPLTPSGLGVSEGVTVAALHPRGFSVEQILSACLTGRVLTVLLLGIVALCHLGLRWKESPAHE